MATVHIFGLNHFLQNLEAKCWPDEGRKSEQEQKSALCAVLCQLVSDASVVLIAEEGKPECRCLGHCVADKCGIARIELTMPIEEREKQGVKTPDYDRDETTRKAAYKIFEQFMFERVNTEKAEAMLVLCGRRHMDGLNALFTGADHEVKTYDIYDYDWYKGIPVETAAGVSGYHREDD